MATSRCVTLLLLIAMVYAAAAAKVQSHDSPCNQYGATAEATCAGCTRLRGGSFPGSFFRKTFTGCQWNAAAKTGKRCRMITKAKPLLDNNVDMCATKAFADDPMVFVGTNIVNSLSLLGVPGNDNQALWDLLASKPAQVSFVVTKDEQHYLKIAVEPLESAQPAQWLGYLGTGAQDTVDKVPSISVPAAGPAAGEPAIVLTGALNGCSIIATADPAVQGNILFYHDSAPKKHLVPPPETAALARLDYSKEFYAASRQGKQFYATAPDGTPLCDLAKFETANSLVMLVFAQGQWNIVAQPQCIVLNGMNKGGLKVVRKTGRVITIPVTLP